MIWVRSLLFYVVFFGGTFVLSVIGGIIRLFAPDRLVWVAVGWARLGIWAARVICNIRLEVSGLENLPPGAALIASRHQSAFDTMVWFTLLPRCCYVLKQELLKIPLMGGLMTATRMIAVDREGGARTVRMLVRQGVEAIAEGRQIVIFPEGTRAEPGALLPLQPGVAALATRTAMPVIPVLTDSGLRWGRRAFHKYPGVIHIIIRPAIPAGLRREALMRALQQELEVDIATALRPVDKSVG
jgi:1-acyl-sn-glycerol-3-phosphate acyltransferase